jgi:hypothetical protein
MDPKIIRIFGRGSVCKIKITHNNNKLKVCFFRPETCTYYEVDELYELDEIDNCQRGLETKFDNYLLISNDKGSVIYVIVKLRYTYIVINSFDYQTFDTREDIQNIYNLSDDKLAIATTNKVFIIIFSKSMIYEFNKTKIYVSLLKLYRGDEEKLLKRMIKLLKY